MLIDSFLRQFSIFDVMGRRIPSAVQKKIFIHNFVQQSLEKKLPNLLLFIQDHSSRQSIIIQLLTMAPIEVKALKIQFSRTAGFQYTRFYGTGFTRKKLQLKNVHACLLPISVAYLCVEFPFPACSVQCAVCSVQGAGCTICSCTLQKGLFSRM